MKILVTGGAGFIGSHLVRQLMEAGDDVISLDNLSTGLRENLPEGARLEVMDTHDDKVEDLFRQEHFAAVVHLAAQTLVSDSMVDPENDMYQNIAGTVHIMECCRKYGVKRVIFSSSAATYGDVDEKALPVQETLPQIPLSFYGLTKMTVEKYLALYHMAFGIHYVVLRFANVYGERQGDGGEGGVISIFAKRLAKGQDITIFGNGKQTRDFVYAGDIARGIRLALTTPNADTCYNLSTQTEISLNELVTILPALPEKKSPILRPCQRRGHLSLLPFQRKGSEKPPLDPGSISGRRTETDLPVLPETMKYEKCPLEKVGRFFIDRRRHDIERPNPVMLTL